MDLTQAAGGPNDSAWLLPTTRPHCGPYRLKLDAQPQQIARSWPARHAATMIPRLAEGVSQSATAVVQADSTRAAVAVAYQSGDRSLDEVLEAVRRQTRQTLAFLEMLETYNRAIARYALAVLPQSVEVDSLLGTLVLQ